jgi:hypothetical protein
MRTLRTTLVGTVVLTLLGGLGGAAVAQSDETPGPEVTAVTGERLTVAPVDETAPRLSEDGFVRWPQVVVTYSWSDPRLPTEMRIRMNVVANHVFSGAVLLEGLDGYWSGTWEAFIGDGPRVHGLLRLTGHGAYDGLIAVLHGTDEQGRDTMSYEGVIVEGDMPPMPEAFDPAE